MTISDMAKYVIGGKAVFTIQSTKIDKRFTYKIRADKNRQDRFYANVLYGADNRTDYRYIGYFYEDDLALKWSQKAQASPTDMRFRMLQAFLSFLCTNDKLPDTCEFYPSGRCARCGRLLTTPESINSGFGPECIKLVEGY